MILVAPSQGQTALHYAALYDQTHLIELLHEHGADIEATNNHEMTPIHYTARSNHLDGLKILVDKGANIHHKDKHNNTVRSDCLADCQQADFLTLVVTPLV